MHTRIHHGALTFTRRLLDALWPAVKSPSALAVRDAESCVPVGTMGYAKNRSGAENRALKQLERRRPKHEHRNLAAVNESLTMRAAHRQTQRDEKARIRPLSARVRRLCREKAPETSIQAVSAISAAYSGKSAGLTIARNACFGVPGASSMMSISHGRRREGSALARVTQGCRQGCVRLRMQSRRQCQHHFLSSNPKSKTWFMVM